MAKNRTASPRQIGYTLAAGGRPNPRGLPYAKLYQALRAVGLNGSQAMAMTCMAYDTSEYPSSTDNIIRDARALRSATRKRHAEESPRGLWASVRDAHGDGYIYMDDNDERVRNWADDETQNKANITRALRDCRTY